MSYHYYFTTIILFFGNSLLLVGQYDCIYLDFAEQVNHLYIEEPFCQYETFIGTFYSITTTYYCDGMECGGQYAENLFCEPKHGDFIIEIEPFYEEGDEYIDEGILKHTYYKPNTGYVGSDTMVICDSFDGAGSWINCWINIFEVIDDCIDCEGNIGGTMVLDDCGLCYDSYLNEAYNTSCADCVGVPNGESVIDSCGVCSSPPNFNSSCTDCQGTLNGIAVIDLCGNCLIPESPAFNACLDCLGTIDGTAVVDACGNCLEPYNPAFDACLDCMGTPDGVAVVDSCGNCLESDNPAFNACLDCLGTPDGAAVVDSCGICLEPDNPDFNACLDLISSSSGAIILDYKVFPNPASEVIRVEGIAFGHVNVFDLNGKLLKTISLAEEINIDCSDWESGIYFLQLKNEQGAIVTEKVIVH